MRVRRREEENLERSGNKTFHRAIVGVCGCAVDCEIIWDLDRRFSGRDLKITRKVLFSREKNSVGGKFAVRMANKWPVGDDEDRP